MVPLLLLLLLPPVQPALYTGEYKLTALWVDDCGVHGAGVAGLAIAIAIASLPAGGGASVATMVRGEAGTRSAGGAWTQRGLAGGDVYLRRCPARGEHATVSASGARLGDSGAPAL
jgi:hypothetical protein